MKGKLPEAVRLRPKTPLGEPYWPFAQRLARAGVPRMELSDASRAAWREFVDLDHPPEITQDLREDWVNLRTVSLGYWLHGICDR
jgi:hypothetical protein